MNVYDYILINFYWSDKNYGAILTAYALQEFLSEYNQKTILLNSGESNRSKTYEFSPLNDFTRKYLNTTEDLGYNESRKLSKNVKGVMLGSDQVLRPKYLNSLPKNKYLLNFVEKNAKKIALSASFGIDYNSFKKEAKRNIIKEMKRAYTSFDYISAREFSGQEIFKKEFNLNSDFILDPVFLVNKKSYDNVINESQITFDGIASYVLDEKDEYNKLFDHLEKTHGSKVIKLNPKEKEIPVEDWLKSIKNCKLFVTDSFHGVCFAIIFNKPFICIKNKNRGETRFDTLIQLLDIKNNFVSSIDGIYENDKYMQIDFETINKILNDEIKKSKNIIEKVLFENHTNNTKNKKRNRLNIDCMIVVYFTKYIFYHILYLTSSGKKKNKYYAKKQKSKVLIKWFK